MIMGAQLVAVFIIPVRASVVVVGAVGLSGGEEVRIGPDQLSAIFSRFTLKQK